MAYRVIDNFLSEEAFKQVKEIVCSINFPWFFAENVANKADESDVFFTHFLFTKNKVNSDYFDPIMTPFIERIEPRAIIRARANLTIGQEKLIEHGRHTDFPYQHKVMLFYVNTCNGFTRLEDDVKVDCVANRALFVDGDVEHNSTNCTDEKKRFVISLNYF
jgi:hypothetical protein